MAFRWYGRRRRRSLRSRIAFHRRRIRRLRRRARRRGRRIGYRM